jgi:acyl carrier protein
MSDVSTEATVADRVLKVVKAYLADGEQVDRAASFADLKMDSLDVVELYMGMEDEFGIEVDEADVDRLDTVEKTISYVECRCRIIDLEKRMGMAEISDPTFYTSGRRAAMRSEITAEKAKMEGILG